MATETLSDAAGVADEDSQPFPRTAHSLRQRDALGLLALVAVVGLLAWLVIASGAPRLKLPGNATSSHTSRFAGLTLSPANPAPPLSLSSYLGDRVKLRDYRGRAVLVAFLYTHCVDVCPLLAANLHTALLRMPASEASRLAIIAVSVDPLGDNRASVTNFLRAHAMTGRMNYLIGSRTDLASVWGAWGVGSQRESANPQLVAHSALVYGVSASGKLMTIYQANFNPAEIVNDVPRLAAS